MQWITLIYLCVIIITVLAVYFPLAYIRLTNKILKTLEQIEINSRKQ
jgi:hypothetical protein